jgi:hypothetical protein
MLPKAYSFTPRFSPTTISFWHGCRKRKVSLCFFAEDAQYDPKTRSYEDNAKFVLALSAKTRIEKKNSNICTNKKIFEKVGFSVFCTVFLDD